MSDDWKPTEINEGQGSNTVYSNSTLSSMRIEQPKYLCTWDIFGGGQFYFHFTKNYLIPNRWVRFWTRVFLNSKWNFEND